MQLLVMEGVMRMWLQVKATVVNLRCTFVVSTTEQTLGVTVLLVVPILLGVLLRPNRPAGQLGQAVALKQPDNGPCLQPRLGLPSCI